MFDLYQQTEMEKRIESLYRKKGIMTPNDLEISNVAKAFEVEINYSVDGPSVAIWDSEVSMIFLNPNLPLTEQREIFFHELCHPLMHLGDQTVMVSNTFRELQEYQANQFQLYAAIPFFMLEKLELPKYDYQIVQLIESVFKIPYSLAKKRLDQIKRRILQSRIDQSLIAWDVHNNQGQERIHIDSFPQLDDLFTAEEIKSYKFNGSNKNIKVYYESFNGKKVPLWYVIELNREDIKWSKDIKFFPIDTEFELVQIKEFENKETDVAIFVSELTLHHSKPNDFGINLKEVKRKLNFFDADPYNITRFVINIRDLEELLQFPIINTTTSII